MLKKRYSKKELINCLILIAFVFTFLCIGVGYSYLRKDLRASGTIKLSKYGPLIELMKATDSPKNDSVIGLSEVNQSAPKGLYIKSGTESSAYPIYFYYGNVENNNVIFANFCWLIVRTTEKSGIKLLYNGKPNSNNQCFPSSAEKSIGETAFNTANSFLGMGYMYGTAGTVIVDSSDMYRTNEKYFIFGKSITYNNSTKQYTLVDVTNTSTTADYASTSNRFNAYGTSGQAVRRYTCRSETETICTTVYYLAQINGYDDFYVPLTNGKMYSDIMKDAKTNTYNSTIKTKIDNWYKSNMTSYTKYLEDAVWCNNRVITSGNMGGK